MLHDLLYEPDMARLRDFKRALGEEYSAGDEARIGEAESCDAECGALVTQSYAVVFNKIGGSADKEIAKYVNDLAASS